MLVEAGVADDVTARGEHFTEEVLGDFAVAAVAGDLIHAGCADDFGNVGVGVQALQLVAALGERIEEAGLLEEVSGVKIAILFGDGGEVDEDFVHAAVLGAQHALALIDAEASHEVLRPLAHAFGDLQCVGVAGVDVHVEQAGHDLVVGVEGRPDRLALREMFEQFGGKGAQVAGSDLLLARGEAGDELIAAALEVGVARSGRSQRNGGEKVPAGEMAAQLAGGIFPAFIGCGAGGNARRDAERMQQPIDRERVEIARIDLFLLLENAGSETDGGQWEGLEPSRRMLGLRRQTKPERLPRADKAETGGAGGGLEEVATRTVNHSDTPADSCLLAARLKAKILAEERHHVILEAVGDGAGMRAGVDFKAVRDAVGVEYVVQLDGVEAQAILVADIHGDGAVLAQISDVLIDEGQRRVGRPLGENVRLRLRRSS